MADIIHLSPNMHINMDNVTHVEMNSSIHVKSEDEWKTVRGIRIYLCTARGNSDSQYGGYTEQVIIFLEEGTPENRVYRRLVDEALKDLPMWFSMEQKS